MSDADKKIIANIRSYAADLRKEVLAGLSREEIQTALGVLNTIRGKLGTYA